MAKKGKNVFVQCLIAMPIITIALALLCAKLIVSDALKEDQTDLCAYTIVGLVGFLTSIYCAMRMPQKKALWGMTTAGAYAAMLLLGNLLFFGVGYRAVWPTLLCILCTGLLGSLLGALRRRKYA